MTRPLVFWSGLAFFSLIVVAQVRGEMKYAADLINLKEQELVEVVDLINKSFGDCDSLQTCNVSTNCSRLSCSEYGTLDPNYSNYLCQTVMRNANCHRLNCNSRNFDFSKSYVRQFADSQISARTVCAQRALDAKFKNMSDNAHFFRVFYGSMDGTMRIFPGADENCTGPGAIYDPRLRPWFRQSTSVKNLAVILLIESGPSMENPIYDGSPANATYISKAKNIALNFLDTLQQGDIVKVMLFNGSNGIYVTPGMSTDFMSVQRNATTELPQLPNLRESITALPFIDRVKNVDPNASDASNAINLSISQLNTSPSNQAALKVIIVLTSDLYTTNLPLADVLTSVNLFVYKLKQANGSALVNCTEGTQASFEEIPKVEIDNPLYAIRSYYSFLARRHNASMGNSKSDFSRQYQDFSGVENDAFTLSKAVLRPDGELLGVVGIDFFPQKLEAQYYPNFTKAELENAAGLRNTTSNSLPSTTISVCFNHTDPCKSNVDNLPLGKKYGLCAETSVQPALDDLSCCHTCNVTSTSGKSGKWPTGKVVGVAIASIIAVLVLLFTGFYFIFTRKSRMKNRSVTTEPMNNFQGGNDDPPVHLSSSAPQLTGQGKQ